MLLNVSQNSHGEVSCSASNRNSPGKTQILHIFIGETGEAESLHQWKDPKEMQVLIKRIYDQDILRVQAKKTHLWLFKVVCSSTCILGDANGKEPEPGSPVITAGRCL